VNTTSGEVNLTTADVIITVCGDGSYCCGQNNETCCQEGGGFWVSDNTVYPYSSSPFTSSSTSSSTATGNPLPTCKNSTCITGGSNAKNIALGVGLGIGIPILILMASILFLVARRNQNTIRNHAANGVPGSDVDQRRLLVELPLSAMQRSELEAG
jgi:hypothetical protein